MGIVRAEVELEQLRAKVEPEGERSCPKLKGWSAREQRMAHKSTVMSDLGGADSQREPNEDKCPMVHAGVEGRKSLGVTVRGRTEHTEAGGRAMDSSHPGRSGSQQAHGVTTPLRRGTERLMGNGDDWVAGVAED